MARPIKYLGIGILVILVISGVWVGITKGNSDGYNDGFQSGFSDGNEDAQASGYKEGYIEGFKSGVPEGWDIGWDLGIEEMIKRCDCDNAMFICYLTQDVTFNEMLNFIKSDQTDKNEFSDDYNCLGYALTLKSNASIRGIRCAVVILYYRNEFTGERNIGHAINAFETTDKGIVYVEPQSDALRYNISIGQSYSSQLPYFSMAVSNLCRNLYPEYDLRYHDCLKRARQELSEDRIVRIETIW